MGEDERVVVEPGRLGDVWRAGDGGEHHQIAGADQLLGAVVHGDPAGHAGLFQIAAEAGRALGVQVEHPDLVERPPGAGQKGVDVARDQADPEEPDPHRA